MFLDESLSEHFCLRAYFESSLYYQTALDFGYDAAIKLRQFFFA
jgi:hypothetical protein